tara:strand:- start:5382 stop:5669 length:288 start_codon:yes stop_codon:yes gene_type:complete
MGYVKLPHSQSLDCFLKINALWRSFLNTICQRLTSAKKSKTFSFFLNMRFMRNCLPINFSGEPRQLATTAQDFENKISEHLLPYVFQRNLFLISI